jgi:hypothetical protein
MPDSETSLALGGDMINPTNSAYGNWKKYYTQHLMLSRAQMNPQLQVKPKGSVYKPHFILHQMP